MKIMKLVNNLFKNPCLYYNSFCLIVLLNCGICSTKGKVSKAPDPVFNTSSSTSSSNLSDSSTLVSNTNAATPVSNTNTSTPVSHTSAATPVSNTSAATPVSNTSAATPMSNTNTSTPVSHTSAATPVSNTNTSTPVSHTSAATPVSHTSAATPVSNTSTSTSVSHTSAPMPVSNSTPINSSNAGKQDQSSIIASLDRVVHEEKSYREQYSQELSKIKDLSERDAKIKLIREERNKRIKEFETLLDKISDANEAKRLKGEFYGRQAMFKKISLVGSELTGISLTLAEYEKEYDKKCGDITEQYNGYNIESKREQITDRVRQLIGFVIDNENIFINRQGREKLCPICHSGESVSCLPCGDFFHVTCLVEKIISRCRLGPSFYAPQCPGSCGNRIECLYFLLSSDESAKKYLTSGEWQKIYTPINKK